MPEGPEIRRAADQIEKALLPLPVGEVSFAFDHLKDYEPQFEGARVEKVETKGKAMLIRFNNGYTIYSHNQLYGKWVVRNAYTYPKTNRSSDSPSITRKSRLFCTVPLTLRFSGTVKCRRIRSSARQVLMS